MSIQQIIESLLRSRLYRTGVEIVMDSGETHRCLVQEVRYDGSRSLVVVSEDDPSHPLSLMLAHIVRVSVPRSPRPRRGAAA